MCTHSSSSIPLRKAATVAAATLIGASTPPIAAQMISVNQSQPALDRWNYPFAANPGGQPNAAIFGAVTANGFDPSFDNRDGQMVIGFDTSSAVEAGLGQWSYIVHSATVFLTVEAGNAFRYDPTPDSYQSWLPPGDPQYLPDSDLGRPVELFGTEFRYGFTATTYGKSAAYSPLGPFGKGVRTAYPVAFQGLECSDISNNVDALFDPHVFAVATTTAVAQGEFVPAGTEMRFELEVSDPHINRWIRRALDHGMMDFSVASIFMAEQQQKTPSYPRFHTKESLFVQAGLVNAARLQMVVEIPAAPLAAGDIDRNGVVNVDDLLAVLGSWGACPCCPADINADHAVNVDDLLLVLATWG